MKNFSMPSMPSIKSGSTDSSSESDLSPSFAEDSVEQSAGSAEVDTERPILIDTSKSGNQAEVRPRSRGIKVVAVEKGFYNQMRLNDGDEFTIRSEEDFGSWFRCIDMVLEEKRKAAMKNKKVMG